MITASRQMLMMRQMNSIALAGFMLLAFASVSHSQTGSAQAVKKKSQQQIAQDLLAQDERPTVHDLLQAFRELPNQNPFRPLAVSYVNGSHLSTLAQEGPRLVADLEAAYPGAVFAFLGRDSALTADIVEAYFLSRGQHGRVVRLNASSGSFGGLFLDYDILMAAGLCGPKPSENDRFVILDATPYEAKVGGRMSQSRRLISAYYKRAAEVGQDLGALLRRVNVVGLGSRSQQNGETISAATVETYFATTNANLGTGPEKILYTTGEYTYLPTSNSNQEIVWHGKFGRLRRQTDGKPVASRGKKTSNDFRAHVLADMYDVVVAVRTPEFHRRVEQGLQSLRARSISEVARVHVPAFVLDEALVDQAWNSETIISQWAEARETAPHAYAFALDRRALDLAWSAFERDPQRMPPAQLAAVIQTVLENAELPFRTFLLTEAKIKEEGVLRQERKALMSMMSKAAEAGLHSALKNVTRVGILSSDYLREKRSLVREALGKLAMKAMRWTVAGTVWAMTLGGLGYMADAVISDINISTTASGAPVVAAEFAQTAPIAEGLTKKLAASASVQGYAQALFEAKSRVRGTLPLADAVFFDKALLATADHLRSLKAQSGSMQTIYGFAKDWSTRMVLAEVALEGAKVTGEYSAVAMAFEDTTVVDTNKAAIEARRVEKSRFLADNAAKIIELYLRSGSSVEGLSQSLVSPEDQMKFQEALAQIQPTDSPTKPQLREGEPAVPLVPGNGSSGAQPKMRAGGGAFRPKRACPAALIGVTGQ